MKPCRYCDNPFEDDILQDHETLCAKNPTNVEEDRKKSEIKGYVKTVVLEKGEIIGMYEAHPSGDKKYPPEEIERIKEVWKDVWPDNDHTSLPFLRDRGFAIRFVAEKE